MFFTSNSSRRHQHIFFLLMRARFSSCGSCERIGNGRCKKDSSVCECFEGYTGPTCAVPKTTKSTTLSTSVASSSATAALQESTVSIDTTRKLNIDTSITSKIEHGNWNVGILVVSLVGVIIVLVIIGLIIFYIWKRRKSRKNDLSKFSKSTEPVIAPPLYDISISRENSIDLPVQSHIYEEVP